MTEEKGNRFDEFFALRGSYNQARQLGRPEVDNEGNIVSDDRDLAAKLTQKLAALKEHYKDDPQAMQTINALTLNDVGAINSGNAAVTELRDQKVTKFVKDNLEDIVKDAPIENVSHLARIVGYTPSTSSDFQDIAKAHKAVQDFAKKLGDESKATKLKEDYLGKFFKETEKAISGKLGKDNKYAGLFASTAVAVAAGRGVGEKAFANYLVVEQKRLQEELEEALDKDGRRKAYALASATETAKGMKDKETQQRFLEQLKYEIKEKK